MNLPTNSKHTLLSLLLYLGCAVHGSPSKVIVSTESPSETYPVPMNLEELKNSNISALIDLYKENVERGLSSDPLRLPKQDDDGDDDSESTFQLGTYGTRLAGNILALLGSAATADVPGILLNSFGIVNDETVGQRIRAFVNFLTNGTGSIPLVPWFVIPTVPSPNISISAIKESIAELGVPGLSQNGGEGGLGGVASHVQESLPSVGSIGEHVGNFGSNLQGHVGNLGSNVQGHVENFGSNLQGHVGNLGSNVQGHVGNFGSNLQDRVQNSQVVQNFQEQTGIGGGGGGGGGSDSSGGGGVDSGGVSASGDTNAYNPAFNQEQFSESFQGNDMQQQQQQQQPQPQSPPAMAGGAAGVISGILSAFGIGTKNKNKQQQQQQPQANPSQSQNPYYYPADPSQANYNQQEGSQQQSYPQSGYEQGTVNSQQNWHQGSQQTQETWNQQDGSQNHQSTGY